jgi:hypothetical protein
MYNYCEPIKKLKICILKTQIWELNRPRDKFQSYCSQGLRSEVSYSLSLCLSFFIYIYLP